jgi:hypothetical protein
MNKFYKFRILSHALLIIGATVSIQCPAYAASVSAVTEAMGQSKAQTLSQGLDVNVTQLERLVTFFQRSYEPPSEGNGSGQPGRTEGSGTR